MPEAPEGRPGHVGHTPQDIGGILSRARAAAVYTNPVALTMPVEFASQTLPLPAGQKPGQESTIQTLLQIQTYKSRRTLRQPYPDDFKAGLQPGPATLGW